MAHDEQTQMEALESLTASLMAISHYLTGILRDIEEGTYTPERAVQDYEALTYNEGIDYMGCLADFADFAEAADLPPVESVSQTLESVSQISAISAQPSREAGDVPATDQTDLPE